VSPVLTVYSCPEAQSAGAPPLAAAVWGARPASRESWGPSRGSLLGFGRTGVALRRRLGGVLAGCVEIDDLSGGAASAEAARSAVKGGNQTARFLNCSFSLGPPSVFARFSAFPVCFSASLLSSAASCAAAFVASGLPGKLFMSER